MIFVLLVGLGGLGALLDGGQKGTSGTTAPTETSATQPSENPHPDSPAGTTKPPAEPSDDPAATPTTKPKPPSTAPPGVVVLRVIDGDTLEVRGDGGVLPRDTVARVRLLEIDTPERGACFADEATARTATLLPPGSHIRAERDVELTDRYDRYLLYVWNAQGTFVNESLVRSGHAEAVLYPPNDKYWTRISDAENAAQQAGAGLWTACPEQPETSTSPPDSPDSAPDTPGRPDLPDGPPAGAPDVDCSDLPGPVWVGPDDPHRLDRDGDGIGCEAD
ncbi:thermonuclease family protein [Streptomyces sp. AC555_RSS877]|uniref:thermonuclease family protein n=1 Tax=Streptomyces sp. AC555_RSS877 TaxID=2823688 RepID=UPI0027E48C1B|nr:thermonuclease family protein [Streptomyces sp. AC555_RSS877]